MFATQQHLFPPQHGAEDPAFPDDEPEFFGGQKVNDCSRRSRPRSTPIRVAAVHGYAYTNCNETSEAIADKGDLGAGLDAWQDALVGYGDQQGFTVNG